MSTIFSAVEFLEESIDINTERGQTYNGSSHSPERSFARIAEIVNTKAGLDLKPSHIALILAELKYVRFQSAAATGEVHRDSLVDFVNYNAIWAELVAGEIVEEQEFLSDPEPESEPIYCATEGDEKLVRAAEAMQYLADHRESITNAIPEGSTAALAAYSRAIQALNQVNKQSQEALFGSPVTDLMKEVLDDPINGVAEESD